MKATHLTLAVFLITMMDSSAANRPTAGGFTTRSSVVAQRGIAATSQPLATQVALDILKAGGTAVDAAIAANATIGLMEPTGNGVGGDLFAIVWDAKSQRLHGLNGSGRSPYGLTMDYFKSQGLTQIPRRGPLAVSVPGAVDGWVTLHKKFGRLPLRKLLAPAIRYAREGFPVSDVIARDWAANAAVLKDYPNFKDTYMPGGQAPRPGEIFKNPGLANTLERIARRGRDGFYQGETARTIAAFIQKQGGFLSEKDLVDHHSDWVEPISTNYRGYEVWEIPPNGQGMAALQMLNILEGYDFKKYGFGSKEHLHLFIEAKKLVFEDRAWWYGDPAFGAVPVKELLSKEYAAKRRKLINLDRAADRFDPGDPLRTGTDTIYMTVADKDGNMISLIQSNYRGIGSGMVPDGLGFCLQNRGESFLLKPGHPNSYAPHKRPFHTIIPAFITKDGQPWMSFGVMGGDMQPQGHVQIVMNLIDFGMGLQQAGDAPRIYHTKSSEPTGEVMVDGGLVSFETGFPEASIKAIVAMGHKLGSARPGEFGGYQAIRRNAATRVYEAASESRKDGMAAGY